MAAPHRLDTDVVVVGSGPGGAAVSRSLARAGRRVLILERGYDHRKKFYYGTYLGALRYTDRMALRFTAEGLNVIAPIMVGGATGMYAGCAALPPAWFKARYGLDIDREVAATCRELEIEPLPPHLRGRSSTRIAEAARGLGYDWFPQPKFMQPSRCHPHGKVFDCRATCMLGCTCRAKWHAAEWIDQAVAHGAVLRTGARVRRVRIEDGCAVGVEGRLGARELVVRADTVVLAAGGLGSPTILQASGMPQAGVGMTMDTTVMVYGRTRHRGTGFEPPMTWSYEDLDAGFMLSTLTDPWLMYPLAAVRKGFAAAASWLQWHRMFGIMIKLKDDLSGGVYPDGTLRKPLTHGDEQRLADAYDLCRRILLAAGASRSSIFMRPLIGTHPSGTVRVGDMLDRNLCSEVKNLYVCDASVFPESLDRPTVLTILGLGRRLAAHLIAAGNGRTAADVDGNRRNP